MNERIRHLLEQISALEEELQSALQEQQKRLLYEIKGRRIEFERNIRLAHRRLRTGLLRWILTIRPRDLLTLPVIYGMFLPLVLLDLSVSLYQFICFPIYGIRKVKRGDYIDFDHRFLAYLNIFEKLNCLFCSYANGLIAYAREIAARTEQYFCPIKHARKLAGHHAHYARFLDYGDAGDLYTRIDKLRDELQQEDSAVPPEERN
ncbi:MAG: hypothetical protein AB1400_11200 [Pseudomonadota bacterium]